MHNAYAEGNMSNIFKNIPVNTSKEPGIIENIFVRANCIDEEINIDTTLLKEYHVVFT